MPRRPEEIREALADNPEACLAAGLDDALVGVGFRCGQKPLAVYSVQKCISIMQARDGLDYDEALEFLEFNAIGAWVGEGTPIWLYD